MHSLLEERRETPPFFLRAKVIARPNAPLTHHVPRWPRRPGQVDAFYSNIHYYPRIIKKVYHFFWPQKAPIVRRSCEKGLQSSASPKKQKKLPEKMLLYLVEIFLSWVKIFEYADDVDTPCPCILSTYVIFSYVHTIIRRYLPYHGFEKDKRISLQFFWSADIRAYAITGLHEETFENFSQWGCPTLFYYRKEIAKLFFWWIVSILKII